jgi:probable F420-dependent oxidoreductase
MHFGLCLPNYGGKVKSRELVEIAVLSEELGFDSVYLTDHVIVPRGLDDPYENLLEPLTMLSYISSRTERVGLGTSVIVVPQRNPVLLAKQLALVDILSNGRVIFGAGGGWLEQEFGYLNANFKRRGEVFDESIKVIRKLWTDDTVSFNGKFFKIENAVFLPKPVQKPIPIWIGGNSNAALRRATELGEGWHPVGIDLKKLRRAVKSIRKSGSKLLISPRITVDTQHNRRVYSSSGERRAVLSGPRRKVIDQVEAYENAGAVRLVLYFGNLNADSYENAMGDFTRDVMSSFN